MTETTYFERPNLKVTDTCVISGVGVFQNMDIHRVKYHVGNRGWYALAQIGLLLFLMLSYFLSSTASPFGDLPVVLDFIMRGILVLLILGSSIAVWLMKLTYNVKIEGTFGKATNVEFDCGTDWRAAFDLFSALNKVTKTNRQNTSRVAGVA